MSILEETKSILENAGDESDIDLGIDILKCQNIDHSIKERILKMVKATFEPEAEIVNSYHLKTSNEGPALNVEYVMFACDSHTCVDFNDTCTIPLKWFRPGFDYRAAYAQTMIDSISQKIKDVEQKQKDTADEIADLQDKLTELEAERKELLTEMEKFKPADPVQDLV